MRTRVATIVGLLAVLALAVPIAGCGDEEEDEEIPEVVEGEPLELGELIYNVSITRFLNPNITEDEAYLEGAPEEPQGMSYLGVFLQIKNEGDEERSERHQLRGRRRQPSRLRAGRARDRVHARRRRHRPARRRDPRARHRRGRRPDPGRAASSSSSTTTSPRSGRSSSRSSPRSAARASSSSTSRVGAWTKASRSPRCAPRSCLPSLAAVVILAGLFSDVVRYVCAGRDRPGDPGHGRRAKPPGRRLVDDPGRRRGAVGDRRRRRRAERDGRRPDRRRRRGRSS